jgi:hypothetical protein
MRGRRDEGTRGDRFRHDRAASGLPYVDRAERLGWGLTKVELFSASPFKLLPPTASPDFESIKKSSCWNPCMT